MTKEDMKIKLREALTDKRYIHSVNVMNTSVELAQKYRADEERCAIAGLLHDCARNIKAEEALGLCSKYGIEADYITRAQPSLLHAPLGAVLARDEYGITDSEILAAISSHTTGRDNMSIIEKIIFLADYIEPGRKFPGVDQVRRAAFEDIDNAMILALDRTIKHIILKEGLIHPDAVTARNYIIYHRK